MITVKLLDSIDDIEDKVNKAIAEEANKILELQKNNILNNCKQLISGWISSQPEIVALQNGILAGQLGLYPGQGLNAQIEIINSITQSISIQFKRFSNKLIGGLDVNFQPKTFVNLLNLPQGIVNYKDGSLPWLKWLLLLGDSIIVVNYQYNAQTGLGRSGLGNMIPGGSFRIPPQYSGTVEDNFVTRALVGTVQQDQIAAIFKKALGG
jgi:hypothetical protein